MTSKPLYKVRNINNMKELLQQSQNLFGDNNAFLLKNKEGIYEGVTYTKYKSEVDALGTALINLGLKDKHIAVISENRYEWCVTYISAVGGVGVIVPLDRQLTISEVENLLIRSNTSAVVFTGKMLKDIKDISANLPLVEYFINMDADEDDGLFLSYKNLIERGNELIEKGDRSYLDAQIDNEKMGILLFTSGTTDLAKGVMLSHKNICSNITSVASVVHSDTNDSTLTILPLHHTYQCTLGFLAMMYNGSTVSFNEGLKHITKNLQETKPTMLVMVPLLAETIYKKIMKKVSKNKSTKIKFDVALAVSDALYNIFKIDIRKRLFKEIHDGLGGNVRVILTGASGIDPEVSGGFRKMGIHILQGYGLTECSPLVIGNNDSAFLDASVGQPIPGVEVKIDNPNENGIGELLVKGDNVMLGYFENETATKKCLKDGWFYTGDLGRMDEDGLFYITGRSKNVIVTKNGKNIFPEEVECYINKSLYVQECIVWGRVDDKSGDTVVSAQIVPNFDAIKEKFKENTISKEELMKLFNEVIKSVNKNMPLYKRVQEFTIREEQFIKTTTQKIKRYMESPVEKPVGMNG